MSKQVAVVDIGALIDECCVNLPNALRQLADAIEAKRLSGRYRHHRVNGFGAGDRFRLDIFLSLSGKIATVEEARAMLEKTWPCTWCGKEVRDSELVCRNPSTCSRDCSANLREALG